MQFDAGAAPAPKRRRRTDDGVSAAGQTPKRRPHTRYQPKKKPKSDTAPTDNAPWLNPDGHHLVNTEQYLWCCRCGALVSRGADAKYLRLPCNGSPPTPQLKRQRESLMGGLDPYTKQPFAYRATLVQGWGCIIL